MQNVPNTVWRPTWPQTQHIQLSVSITLASITVQYCYNLMLNIISWHTHSAIYWFFSWALSKLCFPVWNPKSISVFPKYCHWTIFWTIWITSAATRFVFKRFSLRYPSLYVFSILQANCLCICSTVSTIQCILNHLTQVHAHSSSLFKICFHFVLPCTNVFPNYMFPITIVYAVFVLCLLHILAFHSPAFYFPNGAIM